LAICERIANILDTPITLISQLGKGTCFSVKIPLVSPPVNIKRTHNVENVTSGFIDKKAFNQDTIQDTILVIDNDPLVLKAMHSLLDNWGFMVLLANNEHSIKQLFAGNNKTPNLIIADYHLDDNVNGVDLVQQLLINKQWSLPCIVNSADPSEQVRQHTSDAQFYFIRKPIKSIALRRLIRKLISR